MSKNPMEQIDIQIFSRPFGGDGDVTQSRTYCTVDDVTSSDPWSTNGYVELEENGNTVTIFDRICTTFNESALFQGEGFKLILEAYTSEVSQIGNLKKPNQINIHDVKFNVTLFQKNSVQIIGKKIIGTPIFTTKEQFINRHCISPHIYTFKSPGFIVNPGNSSILGNADNIGIMSFYYYPGKNCIE